MGRETIMINFRASLDKADELDGIAADLLRAVEEDYEGSLGILSDGWKGANADAYIRKGIQFSGQLRTTAKNLQEAAERIRTIAGRMYRAEMIAVRLAEGREY